MKKYLKFTFLPLLLWSCAPKTEAFNYGEDQCSFCKMSIVDDKYAAETVTSKGKVYKYDDISCMIRHHRTMDKTDFAFRVVNNFDTPEEFLDVEKAFFVQSDEYSSPMGGNTAAFSAAEKNAGSITWPELQKKFD
ncbi:nitrous oxide reductase accessory protein NosL [Leadbetterella sp. DM7]|uniref:nitrous oxide reductase accessory protein NosL n=1 Tax=Leadbetterella sp. DM7 TaxID=3235085 RepID=UPI00349EE9C9